MRRTWEPAGKTKNFLKTIEIITNFYKNSLKFIKKTKKPQKNPFFQKNF
jgi:preprotein translocase subunit Sss1